MNDYTVKPLNTATWGVALRGALGLISQAGGGVVEAYAQDMHGRKTSASFLYEGTRGLFRRAGFAYRRPKGKNDCVMRLNVLSF